MNFIKKNLFLLGGIVVFCLGCGLFVYGELLQGKNIKKLESVRREYEGVVSSRKKIVTHSELKEWRKIAELADLDAVTINDMALQTARRPLIYDEVFPMASKTYSLAKYREFGERYIALVDHFLLQIHAGSPPSKVDVDQATEEFNEKIQNATGGKDKKGQLEKLKKDIHKQRSNEIAVYAGRDVFLGYDFWKYHRPGDSQVDHMESDSWYTQIATWIQEDVVQAVAQINSGSPKISDSVVKRLLEISFGGPRLKSKYDTSFSRGQSRSDAATRRQPGRSELLLPEYVIKIGDTYNGEMATSWTMQASDDKSDVVHFEVGVIIDTRRINDFINMLQAEKYTDPVAETDKRNQITVLQVLQDPVFFEDEIEAGYYYGSASVCVLRVICEYIFFKEGYQEYIPESVKEKLEMMQSPIDKKK